jgi:hypothetical protein
MATEEQILALLDSLREGVVSGRLVCDSFQYNNNIEIGAMGRQEYHVVTGSQVEIRFSVPRVSPAAPVLK